MSLRATGVYGDLSPNKWDDLIDDYLAGRPVAARAGTEVHGRDVGRAVRLMLEAESTRISGEIFNVSDVNADTRDILSPVRRETGCRHPLPDATDKASVNVMDTGKIRALGWTPFAVTNQQVSDWLSGLDLPPGFDVILPPRRPLDPIGDPDATIEELSELAAAGATIVKASLVHHSLAHCLEQLEALAACG